MYYRRNADEGLRDLERRYAQGDMSVLPALNAALVRAGQPQIAIPKRLPSLEFGYNPGLHPDATAAWGARAIFRRGNIDLVRDRQSINVLPGHEEDRERLIAVLNGEPSGTGAIFHARHEAQRLYNMGTLRGGEANEVILYEDDEVVILGNTNASHGYLYMVGFLKPEISESGMVEVTQINEEGHPITFERPAVPWVSTIPTCEVCGTEKIRTLLTPCEQCEKLLCEAIDCKSVCEDCGRTICAEHLGQERCSSCDDHICWSEQCTRRNKECSKCGRLYCPECRDEVSECECQDEKWCENCGEMVEECEECGEDLCICSLCKCADEDEEDEDEEDEDEDEDEDEEWEENPAGFRPGRGHRSRTETRTCSEPGCREKTKEGKPYCREHILQAPYAMRIQQMMEAREAEEEAAAKSRARLSSHLELHPESLPIQELLMTLKMEGSKSIARLAIDLQLDKEVIERYARYLKSQGKVQLRRGKRKGQIFVHLVEDKRRNPYLYPYCDSCRVLIVDNVATHELGCPTIECDFCGGVFIPESKWQTFCSRTCEDAY